MLLYISVNTAKTEAYRGFKEVPQCVWANLLERRRCGGGRREESLNRGKQASRGGEKRLNNSHWKVLEAREEEGVWELWRCGRVGKRRVEKKRVGR